MRRSFSQLRQSRFARVLGLCQENIPAIAEACNEVTERLINEFGQYGPMGCWDRIAFTATRANPYFTLPYNYARAIGFDFCRFPVRIQNEFFQILDAGIGLRGPTNCIDPCGPIEAYQRAQFPTMIDLSPTNQLLRIYPTDPADVGKSVQFSNALDQNGNGIYTTAPTGQVNGFILTLNEPFTTTDFVVTSFVQLAKDITNGDVILTQVDATTGTEVTLSRYKPWETNPAYRRYYFGGLPNNCCNNVMPNVGAGNVVIEALAKVEYMPVSVDTDPLLISNIPAMIEGAQALNYSSMDSPVAAGNEAKHWKKATRLLQQELEHYLGSQQMPAVNWQPFGTAHLGKQGIGCMT